MTLAVKDMISIHAIHILLNSDERLLQFLFDHQKVKLRESPAQLLDEAKTLSACEFLLISIAIDIWCGEASTPINKILADLCDQYFLRFLQAMAYQKELVEAWESLSCLN